MVGRLVQQQQPGAAEQQLRELQLRPLAAAQKADRHGEFAFGKSEAGQRRLRPAAEGQAAARVVALGQLGLLRNQRVHVRRLRLKPAGKLLQFPLHPHQRGEDRQHLVQRAAVRVAADVLLHVPETGPPGHADFTAVGGQLAGQDLKERGFPAAVPADQADAVVCLYFKGDVLQNAVASERFADSACAEQSHLRLTPCLCRNAGPAKQAPHPGILPVIIPKRRAEIKRGSFTGTS